MKTVIVDLSHLMYAKVDQPAAAAASTPRRQSARKPKPSRRHSPPPKLTKRARLEEDDEEEDVDVDPLDPIPTLEPQQACLPQQETESLEGNLAEDPVEKPAVRLPRLELRMQPPEGRTVIRIMPRPPPVLRSPGGQHRFGLSSASRPGRKPADPEAAARRYECEFCGCYYSLLSNRNRHMRLKHRDLMLRRKAERVQRTGNICLEPGCGYRAETLVELRLHLTESHQLMFTEDALEFSDLATFQHWKNELENENHVNFIKTKASKTVAGYECFVLSCNRAGKYRGTGGRGIRRYPAKGKTCKMGHNCTASISVRRHEQTGAVFVLAILQHYGHDLRPEYVRVPKLEKQRLAAKLRAGVPLSSVMDSINASTPTDVEERLVEGADPALELTRVQLASKEALRSMLRRYGDVADSRASAEMVLHEHADSVLYRKWPGEPDRDGFAQDELVLALQTADQRRALALLGNGGVGVDRSRLHRKFGFVLHTLVVVDDSGLAYAAGHLLTNCEDSFRTTQLLFRLLRENTFDPAQQAWAPEWMLTGASDDALTAFREVTGADPTWFIVPRLMKDYWMEHLGLVSEPSRRAAVAKRLHGAFETEEVAAFEAALRNLVVWLSAEPSAAAFGQLVEDDYAARRSHVAACFGADFRLVVEHFVLQFHRLLERSCLGRRSGNRVCRVVEFLLMPERDSRSKMLDWVRRESRVQSTRAKASSGASSSGRGRGNQRQSQQRRVHVEPMSNDDEECIGRIVTEDDLAAAGVARHHTGDDDGDMVDVDEEEIWLAEVEQDGHPAASYVQEETVAAEDDGYECVEESQVLDEMPPESAVDVEAPVQSPDNLSQLIQGCVGLLPRLETSADLSGEVQLARRLVSRLRSKTSSSVAQVQSEQGAPSTSSVASYSLRRRRPVLPSPATTTEAGSTQQQLADDRFLVID